MILHNFKFHCSDRTRCAIFPQIDINAGGNSTLGNVINLNCCASHLLESQLLDVGISISQSSFAFAFVLPSVAGCLCQQHVNWMSATGKMTDNGSLDISSSAGRALVQSLNRADFTPNDNILTAFKSNQCHECQTCKDNGHSKSIVKDPI